MRVAGAVLLALSTLLAGCTSLAMDPTIDAARDAETPPTPPTTVLPRHYAEPEDAPAREHLDLDLTTPWVKPRNLVDATVAFPDGKENRWLVSAGGALATATPIGNVQYLRGGTSENTLGAKSPAANPRIDTGNLPPGVLSQALVLSQPGAVELKTPRHPDVHLRVDVLDGIPPREAEVSIVNDGYGFRFVPSALILGAGSSLRVYNDDNVTNAVIDHRIWTQFATNVSSISLIGVDLGWYELSVQNMGPAGLRSAEARAFLLIDFDAPSSRASFGPYGGGYTLLPTNEAREYPLQALRPVAELVANVTLKGDRLTGETRIDIALDGEVLASKVVTESGRFVFESLPAGELILRVVGGESATHGFDLQGEIQYDIILPPVPGWLAQPPSGPD